MMRITDEELNEAIVRIAAEPKIRIAGGTEGLSISATFDILGVSEVLSYEVLQDHLNPNLVEETIERLSKEVVGKYNRIVWDDYERALELGIPYDPDDFVDPQFEIHD